MFFNRGDENTALTKLSVLSSESLESTSAGLTEACTPSILKLYQLVGKGSVCLSGKRDQIIEVTAKLIHSKGYENTKLSDILDAAQIGKGQFYHYFSSKHELGLAILDHFFQSWNQRLLEDILSSPKDPETKFNEMLDWIVQLHKRNRAKCGCVFGNLAVEMSEHDEEFRRKLQSVFEVWINKLATVIASMIPPAKADSGDVRKVAQGVVALIEGGILLMKSQQDIEVLVNTTELAKSIVNNFVQQHSGQ